MRHRILTSALLTFFIGSQTFGAPSKIKIIGQFSHFTYENGNDYGWKIIIYKTIGYWVVFHDIDTNRPIVVPAEIKKNQIEFTIPSFIDPSFPPMTFKGKIFKNRLVGNFTDFSTPETLKRESTE